MNQRQNIYCPSCKCHQWFKRIEPKHGFHALMTVLTLGLWSVSWLAVSIVALRKLRECPECGAICKGRRVGAEKKVPTPNASVQSA